MSELLEDFLYVVAIDFGTTYSGYAYSSITDYNNDPLQISTNQTWNAGSQQHCSLKTPTCILLDDKEEFVAFGYQAENTYAEKVIKGKQNEYFFFQRFKMQLYKSEQIKADMVIEDVTGKSLSAMKVFSESIKALMKHVNDNFTERGFEVLTTDIRWVLTVPAIWTDAAKQFMRKSAMMAGIADNQLLIALEPEAASIYCQYLPIEKLQGADKGFVMSKEGTKYMVVDNGGGTVDITVHEKMANGTLKELCQASGGDCGGTSVDMGLLQIFVKLVGAPIITSLIKEEPSAYLDMFRDFEVIKRTVGPEKKGNIYLTVPTAILDDMCMEQFSENFTAIVTQSIFKDQINLKYGKMRFDVELLKDLFRNASDKIVHTLNQAIEEYGASEIGLIVLVGAFSQCKYIQADIKANFSKSKVIVPEDAGIAVLKGAVLFGHRPDYIISRIARYTYGIESCPVFDPKIHDKAKERKIRGKKRCNNVFTSYIKRGENVRIGSSFRMDHSTVYSRQPQVNIHIFQSKKYNPKYIDEEGCNCVGTLKVKIPKPTRKKRDIRVEMIFGRTELMVIAEDVHSGENCETTIDFIQEK